MNDVRKRIRCVIPDLDMENDLIGKKYYVVLMQKDRHGDFIELMPEEEVKKKVLFNDTTL